MIGFRVLVWWKSIDKTTLLTSIALLALGIMLVTSASPTITRKIGFTNTFFIYKHIACVVVGIVVIFSLSAINIAELQKVILVIFVLILTLLVYVHFFGYETKGARRWVMFFGISLQPSELLKPFFILVISYFLSHKKRYVFGFCVAIFITLIISSLLLFQPDVGMTGVFMITSGFMFFINGMPVILCMLIFVSIFCTGVGAYVFLPYIADRINRFLQSQHSYQISKAITSFRSGGLFGVGPGEGRIKEMLPDSHTDFIFAVACEELGALSCAVIVFMFVLIIVRNFKYAVAADNQFHTLAISGLTFSLGLQAAINIAVNLNMAPTKGMTLPFISCGGSSILASSLSIGFLLSLTRSTIKTSRYSKQIFHF
ncbi:FtsW/RodA/SpoVE family cell cycle protein [Candidatus Sneabacter namystus]|uniref:Probable peptidoglycan glycosyltransferase FtsW n=1 Tax=Candidatus Sneabacter namystus TaxID=2601646 RepID=A0A5C0UH93_9RICK|nr:FtsW/RodA/SpoVE family cell cycle protein [Candidatus Sneabacter namystus]QEK39436.1 cell division protein FtsW [Candidatus Sneabacter namystus]